jgi:uncharacterized protein (DUF1684 family)
VATRRHFAFAAALLAVAAGLLWFREAGQTDYAGSITTWRHERLERLTSDDGWLTVAGLFWLDEGDHRAGAGAGNDIVLPAGSTPARVGVFTFHAGRTTFRPEPGVAPTLNGRPLSATPGPAGTDPRPAGAPGAAVTGGVELRADQPGPPDVLALNDLSMFVIKRGDRFGIRLRDKNAPARRDFKGLSYFPIRKEYRIVAEFTPYDPPRSIPIPNILGTVEEMPCPGFVRFTLDGKSLRLEPVIEEPGARELFYIFRDETSGVETYPSGRFFYTPMPENGKVILDFNKAYNPPCAFTPYATCPLPPKQNWLPVRVEAGEKSYGHH